MLGAASCDVTAALRQDLGVSLYGGESAALNGRYPPNASEPWKGGWACDCDQQTIERQWQGPLMRSKDHGSELTAVSDAFQLMSSTGPNTARLGGHPLDMKPEASGGLSAVAQSVIRTYGEHDVDALAALYAADATLVFPGAAFAGRDEIKGMWRAWFDAFPNVASQTHRVWTGPTLSRSSGRSGARTMASSSSPACASRRQAGDWNGRVSAATRWQTGRSVRCGTTSIRLR
jgi:SnoaL-like domain